MTFPRQETYAVTMKQGSATIHKLTLEADDRSPTETMAGMLAAISNGAEVTLRWDDGFTRLEDIADLTLIDTLDLSKPNP
jgi:hypothetical protein